MSIKEFNRNKFYDIIILEIFSTNKFIRRIQKMDAPSHTYIDFILQIVNTLLLLAVCIGLPYGIFTFIKNSNKQTKLLEELVSKLDETNKKSQ